MTQLQQPSLFEEPTTPAPSPARVRALAGILAGFAWPGLGGHAHLSAKQQALIEEIARDALASLARSDP